MLNERMVGLGTQRSVIRELFEFGKQRAAEIGAENVFDFSIGNPSVPAPDAVNETAIRLLNEVDPVILHGYTSAQGDAGVRQMISDSINSRHLLWSGQPVCDRGRRSRPVLLSERSVQPWG